MTGRAVTASGCICGPPRSSLRYGALLRLPMGQLASYGDVAMAIGAPSSARAVGSVIGQNTVAFLIPCRRVIRAGGQIGDYAWGAARKTAMIGWEGARAGPS